MEDPLEELKRMREVTKKTKKGKEKEKEKKKEKDPLKEKECLLMTTLASNGTLRLADEELITDEPTSASVSPPSSSTPIPTTAEVMEKRKKRVVQAKKQLNSIKT